MLVVCGDTQQGLLVGTRAHTIETFGQNLLLKMKVYHASNREFIDMSEVTQSHRGQRF